MRICAIAERMERRVMLAVSPGPEFRVNTFVDNDQIHPATAMDAAGNFVIVWQSAGEDEPPSLSTGIYGQRYDAAGAPVGGEFLVNTTTAGSQTLPAVAMNGAGDFVVAWESGDFSAQKGIFAQRFNAAAVKQGPEFLANTHLENQQGNPSVAIDADGDFVIAWQSAGQDHPLPGSEGRALPDQGRGRTRELVETLRNAGWDGWLDVEIFSTPDGFWALPPDEAARRAHAAASALLD